MLDLNPVYNYYATVYTPKAQTKYDSHKTSELKTHYNNMVKVNTNSPLFQVKVTDQLQNYAIGLKSAAIGLKNMSAFLADDEEQAFSKLMLHSSEPQTLSGKIITEDYDKLPKQLSFEIEEIAKGQVNMGTIVNASEQDVIPGAYSFTIEGSDGSQHFNMNVLAGESNLTIQHHLASMISDADIGINAYTMQEGNYTRMVLESDDTGTDHANSEGKLFQVLEGEGHVAGIVTAFGLDQTTEYPSNAAFTINDTPQSSSSNNIVINKMIEIELHAATSEPVQFQFVPDTNDILDKIKEFTDSYNQIIDIAQEHSSSQRGAKKLIHNVRGIVGRHQSALESVGLRVAQDGRMTTDDALLTQSILSGEVQKMFTDLSGFREDITAKTEEISLDPMNYVDKTVITYPHPGHEFNNPYMPSMYSGMLYNYYV